MAKNFLRPIPLLVFATCMTFLPRLSFGSQLQVCHSGCAYSSIQSAVDAAASGDTIFVSAGLYSERVTVAGKSLTIEGTSNTIVQGVGVGGPVFTLGAGSGPYYEVDLSYLTVTGGDHNTSSEVGGGIQVRVGAYLHLSNVTVTSNSAAYGGGIGIMTSGGPPSTLAQCSVVNNSGVYGGGIYVGTGASVDVQQCSISNNTAWFNGGGIDAEASSTLTVEGSTIDGNQLPGHCNQVEGSMPSDIRRFRTPSSAATASRLKKVDRAAGYSWPSSETPRSCGASLRRTPLPGWVSAAESSY